MHFCLACGRPKGYDGCEHCNQLAKERIEQQIAAAKEDARRLARYDEAVGFIEKFLRDGLEPQLARRAEAFLAAEPKEGK